MEIYNVAKKYFEENREAIIADLSALVSIPSVLSEPKENAPSGVECARVLKAALEMFEREGFSVRVGGDGLYGIVDMPNGEKTIGVFSHSDVVPVGDDWTVCAPFEPKLVGNRLFGRGTSDNKNAIVFGLWFMKMQRDCNIKLKNSLRLFVGTNEETGMNDIDAFVKNEKMPDLSIVPDNSYPVSLGEKGRTLLYCKSDSAFEQILDVAGGAATNILLGECVAYVRYDQFLYSELCAMEKKELSLSAENEKIKIVASGLPAHAAHPEKGVNAMKLLCSALIECKHLCANDKKILQSALVLLSCNHGESFGAFAEDCAFGKTSCANGIVKCEDGHLVLSFDIRYGTKIDTQRLCEEIERKLGELSFRVDSLDAKKCFEIPQDNVFAATLLNSYKSLTKKMDASFFYSGGGTYAGHLENAFSIGMSINREEDFSDLGAGHGCEHQGDEFINVDGFIEAMAINTEMIFACDEIL